MWCGTISLERSTGLSLSPGPARPHHTSEPLLCWEQPHLRQEAISAGREAFRRSRSKPTCIPLWTVRWRCFLPSIVVGRSMRLVSGHLFSPRQTITLWMWPTQRFSHISPAPVAVGADCPGRAQQLILRVSPCLCVSLRVSV